MECNLKFLWPVIKNMGIPLKDGKSRRMKCSRLDDTETMVNEEEFMKDAKKKPFVYYIRMLHRDIGFFVAGLVLLYSISGVVLIYRDRGFLNHSVQIEKKLQPNINSAELGNVLRMRDFKVVKTEGEIVYFKGGTYNTTTGIAACTIQEPIFPLNKIINLHKTASASGAFWFSTLFGVLLAFLAVSSFWMFDASAKPFQRGIKIAGAGVLLTIVMLCI